MTVNEKIFREYDIRGIADKDLTHETVTLLGKALGTYLKRNAASTITVGRDCRVSSQRIHDELIKNILSTGINVIDVGLVPTPLLYFSVFDRNVGGGVQITGSHNPPEHNGFKIVCGKTTIYGDEIQKIKQLILRKDFETGKGSISEFDVRDNYISEVHRSIKGPLNVRVVVDHGNGMGAVVAGDLYRKLGCEVVELFNSLDGTFPNHHPDPTVVENLIDITNEVQKRDFPVGIAFDGDADRIGVVDKSGKALFGDELLVIYSRDILQKQKGARIIADVKASNRLFNDISAHGGVPILWKTGHSLIKAKMKEEKALLAGEMSGHIFFNDRYFGYDDAIYAGARLLEILSKTKKTPGELIADLPPSYCTAEIRVDCSDEKKFSVVNKAKQKLESLGHTVNPIDGARVEFADGWGLVRASNTQPILVFRFEATSQARLKEIQMLVEGAVKESIASV